MISDMVSLPQGMVLTGGPVLALSKSQISRVPFYPMSQCGSKESTDDSPWLEHKRVW